MKSKEVSKDNLLRMYKKPVGVDNVRGLKKIRELKKN